MNSQINSIKWHTHTLLLQEEEEEEENRLSEAAESRFAEQQRGEQDVPLPATMEQPEASGASFVNISFDLEPEAPLSTPDTNRVPSALLSWERKKHPTSTHFDQLANP